MRVKGVQAGLKETGPDSVFVHCANYSLDLVLQDVAREVRLVGCWYAELCRRGYSCNSHRYLPLLDSG